MLECKNTKLKKYNIVVVLCWSLVVHFRRIINFVFAFGAITIVLVYRLFCICNTMIHETEKRLGMISWIVALSVTNVSKKGVLVFSNVALTT